MKESGRFAIPHHSTPTGKERLLGTPALQKAQRVGHPELGWAGGLSGGLFFEVHSVVG